MRQTPYTCRAYLLAGEHDKQANMDWVAVGGEGLVRMEQAKSQWPERCFKDQDGILKKSDT